MTLYCLTHGESIDWDLELRRRKIRLVMGIEDEAQPGADTRRRAITECALFWAENPQPGTLWAKRWLTGQEIGPCHVVIAGEDETHE